MAQQREVTLMGVGDVFVSRDDPESIFRPSKPILATADVLFGNCEGPYTEVRHRNPAARGVPEALPSNVLGLKYAAFDVMSFANNHHLDLGYEAFSRTLAVLHEAGVATCGAGKDIEEARRPAIVEKNGVKVAFLAYNSILFHGYEAGASRPGCAPLKVYTYYHQEEYEQPGSQPTIFTIPDEEHLAALKDDIKKVRPLVDVLVVTFHWGLHFVRAKLADYERRVARVCIDEGADVIMGHHQHILKPIDVYKGKVIFYGLANFACDFGDIIRHQQHTSPDLKKTMDRYPGVLGFWPDYPSYPFWPQARQTIIAKCQIVGGKIQKISYIPCMIDPDNAPVPLAADDERFGQLKTYMEEIGQEQEIDTKFAVEGNEVVVCA